MKKIQLICLSFILLFETSSRAQYNHFIREGIVTYEKKINMFAFIKKTIDQKNYATFSTYLDQYEAAQPQFRTLKSVLRFKDNQSLFIPSEKGVVQVEELFNNHPFVTQNNTVYTDFNEMKSVNSSTVLAQPVKVEKALGKMKWKITSETRTIAGYSCRRANALISDSIYVVAFYCDDIPVSSGPESFHGLPGLILQVTLPHYNVTWTAQSVSEQEIDSFPLKNQLPGETVEENRIKQELTAKVELWAPLLKRLALISFDIFN